VAQAAAPALHLVFLQELQALITYIQMNKDSDTDWFTIQPEDGGKAWKGKCWCVAHSMLADIYLAVAAPALLQQPGSIALGQHGTVGIELPLQHSPRLAVANAMPKGLASMHLFTWHLLCCVQVRAQLHQVRV
jgi:hypothetical protein